LPRLSPRLRVLRITYAERDMIEIQIGEGDRIEWALKQFRRKMLRSGLFKDMKKKRFYEKPSEARKRKAADARRRNARARRRR
jgi:small subunit ribosomal protein S21